MWTQLQGIMKMEFRLSQAAQASGAGCCNISRVTGAGTGLCASLKWNRKIRDFLVPTGNRMVRGDLAQVTHFTDEKETTRGSQRGRG